MPNATSRQVLDELFADRKLVGVAGCEIYLAKPSAEMRSAVHIAHAELQDHVLARPKDEEQDMEWTRKSVALHERVATLAVAATFIVEDEAHPSGDMAQAGRLIGAACETDDGVVPSMRTDLVREALLLCAIILPPLPKEGEEPKAAENPS